LDGAQKLPQIANKLCFIQKGLDGSTNLDNYSSIIDLEEGGTSTDGRAVHPRGHKLSKQDLKRDTSSLVLQATLKGLMAEKEESNAKRDKRKRWEKEEQLISFVELKKDR
jgi:hypothetical protein